jgi:molybdenum cofactor cytidylyltransferase
VRKQNFVSKIAAIILAAGESSRFGKPKQLIRIDRKSLIRRGVDEAHEANCSPIIVVSSNLNDEIKRELRATNATIVENENWKRGIGTSIRAGVRYLIDSEHEVETVVLLVCDQPFVNSQTIRDLIALHETTKKPIVASRYADTLGVPALFDRSRFHELLVLDGDSGAKAIILSNLERVAELMF